MKKYRLKIAVGLLALIVGVAIVWLSGIVQILMPQPSVSPQPAKANEPFKAAAPTEEETGKVTVNFKGFEIYKEWVAKFEISNYTAKPITYIGFKSKQEFDFCTLVARRDEISERTGMRIGSSGTATKVHCRESNAVILQTIAPGEKVLFSVFKNEVQELVRLDEKYKNAQIGFEFFVGDEKRREIFWSEDITFPASEN
jgi:hypothetical protein